MSQDDSQPPDDPAEPDAASIADDTDPSDHGMSRRRFLGAGAVAGAFAVVGRNASPAAAQPVGPGGRGGPGGPPGQGGGEQLVLVNGRIHTMDGDDTIARSVSIADGRIVAVGSGAPAAGPGTRVINLRGRTVVPGIIDNHNHIVLMGNRPGHHTPLENAYSITDIQEIYAARAADVPAGEWITTLGGFHQNHFFPPDETPRMPTLAELDEAVPDHPVYLSQSFSGPSATNSLGKALFEAAPLPVPVGDDGSIAAGAGATGRATLFLRQTLLDDETRQRGVIDAIAYGLGLGVTTHLDQGAFQATNQPSDGAAHEDNFRMHLPFLAVHDNGRLDARLRINFLHMESDPATPELVERLRNAFQFFGGDMARTGGIGEFIAQGTNPAGAFGEAARRIAQAQWRAEVHSLSATDFQNEIIAFENAHAEFPITELRWVIAHVPFITEPWVDRLRALGGGLSLTGWRYLAGSPASNGPPFRMIVDNGINAGMSSDGMQIAPMNPWLHMYYATTGLNARGVLINDGQQISRQEVLRLYTSDNGWFLREEDDLGTIEPGKLADLVVLDRDYFSVPDEDLKQLRSVLTVVGGEVVHDAGDVT